MAYVQFIRWIFTLSAMATDEDIQKLLGIKRTRSFALLKQMADAGLVKIIGRGADRRIILGQGA
jgi:ATP-dependent DNA helicase RecG